MARELKTDTVVDSMCTLIALTIYDNVFNADEDCLLKMGC